MECCYHDKDVPCQCKCHRKKKKVMVYNFETEQFEEVSGDERSVTLDLVSFLIDDVIEDHEK